MVGNASVVPSQMEILIFKVLLYWKVFSLLSSKVSMNSSINWDIINTAIFEKLVKIQSLINP